MSNLLVSSSLSPYHTTFIWWLNDVNRFTICDRVIASKNAEDLKHYWTFKKLVSKENRSCHMAKVDSRRHFQHASQWRIAMIW